MKRITHILPYILLLLCAVLCSCGCTDSESSLLRASGQNDNLLPKVSVQEVAPVSVKNILVLPGETEAWHDVRVAADTAGTVEWIGPREGDMVEKGQLLAKIDVSALKVALDRAQAAFKLADDLASRREQLFARKIINEEEMDHSRTERILALGNLQHAKVEYERGFVHSPVRGVMNYLFVDEGEFVDRGAPMADVVNIDRIKINVSVPELDVRYMAAGQKTEVRIDAFPESPLSGTIDFVAYKAAPVTKTFLVRTIIENPGHTVRPGMIARVSFVRRVIPDALMAPLFALVDKGGERLVFIEKDGVAHARTVSIGVIEGDRVQITHGLARGDRLIVTGQRQVEEGMKVRVQ